MIDQKKNSKKQVPNNFTLNSSLVGNAQITTSAKREQALLKPIFVAPQQLRKGQIKIDRLMFYEVAL